MFFLLRIVLYLTELLFCDKRKLKRYVLNDTDKKETRCIDTLLIYSLYDRNFLTILILAKFCQKKSPHLDHSHLTYALILCSWRTQQIRGHWLVLEAVWWKSSAKMIYLSMKKIMAYMHYLLCLIRHPAKKLRKYNHNRASEVQYLCIHKK